MKKTITAISAVIIITSLAATLTLHGAPDYYVATNGNDSATGTAPSNAWQTISHAINAIPGSTGTIHIAAGIYPERLHLTAAGRKNNRLILQAASGTIIDGSTLTVTSGMDALISIENAGNIEISGFELRNFASSAAGHVPIGIYVHGACTNIILRRLVIHHVATDYDNGGDNVSGGDAHAIAVYGDNPSAAITNITINSVEIHDCRLGSSEALVLNGNVSGFEVSQCLIHDNNNIGIDFIGHEGTCSAPQYDQARNGVCRSNTVSNICTLGNPAYREGSSYDRSADGIYVDGGRQIVIEQNHVHNCDIAIEVASEHAGKSTSFITVRNNILTHGYTGGIFCGGYNNQRGSTVNCTFTGNTLYHNNTAKDYSGEITLQYHITNCVFRNNLIIALKNDGGDAVFFGGPGGSDTTPVNSSTDYNWFWSDESSSPSWRWGNSEFYSITDWRSAGHDINGFFGTDPLLKAPAQNDFHLQSDSPACDRGELRGDIGSRDIDGDPRTIGSAPDIGADETAPRQQGLNLRICNLHRHILTTKQ